MSLDSSLVAVVMAVINFGAAFEKEHGISFLAARIVDIIEDRVLSDFHTSNCRQKY